MRNAGKCVAVTACIHIAAFGQMKNTVTETTVFGHGEPVDGFQKASILTAENAEEVLQKQQMEFHSFNVPVTVWRYALQDRHAFLNRALEADVSVETTNQYALLTFGYSSPENFMCAGIANGQWYLGHRSGLDDPNKIQDTNTYKTVLFDRFPQVGTNYTFRLEVSSSMCIFNAFEQGEPVFEAIQTYPDGVFNTGSSGTIVFGDVNRLPETKEFQIKRLFAERTAFPGSQDPRDMPPDNIPETTEL